jgi:FKBP-type peptidyl-prolyl cis-trans isomerase
MAIRLESNFAYNFPQGTKVTVEVPEGIILTLQTASLINPHHGEHHHGWIEYVTAHVPNVTIASLNKHSPTLVGLGLRFQGPVTFGLNAHISVISVMGNIEWSKESENDKTPFVQLRQETEAMQQDDEIEEKEEEVKALRKSRRSRKRDRTIDEETHLDTANDVAVQEITSSDQVELQEPQTQSTAMNKRKRRKLAKQKMKELEDTLSQLHCGKKGAEVATTMETANESIKVPIIKERHLPGGVAVKDIILGQGSLIKAGRKVKILYTGTLADSGQVFDKKRDRNAPLVFRAGTGQVVKGLERGIEGMRAGGEREITIPPELGYGAKGSGSVIPPNATLVFEVQLLSVGN